MHRDHYDDDCFDEKEMDALRWKLEIERMMRQTTREQRAYLIIKRFFEQPDPSDEVCRKFMGWFKGR